MIVRFLDRTFAEAKNRPPVRLTVSRYSKAALGGCTTCEIQAAGDENALWQLLGFARYGVEIQTDNGTPVWWGYVHEIEVSLGALAYGQSMDRFANRVAVAYSYNAPGSNVSARATTTWAQDDISIGDYGYKEALPTLNDATQAQAEAYRTSVLSTRANPLPKLNLGKKSKGASARLFCRGWGNTLGWRFYSTVADQQLTAFETEPETGTVEMGSSAGNVQVAQAFWFPGTAARYTPTLIRLKWVRLGTPTDNLLIDVCTNNAAAPDAILTTYTVAGSTLPTTHTWVDIPIDSQAGLTPATTYWLRMRRSGAPDAVNFYRFAAQAAGGYGNGFASIYNGTTWAAQASDMLFKIVVGSVVETSEQIRAVVTATGQFITGIDIEDASGIYTNAARDGDLTGLQYVTDLLATGTSAGRRYLWEVTRDRRLRVYQEPDSAFPSHVITRDGNLLNAMSAPIRPELATVGVWARTTGVPSAVNDAPTFIESSDYDLKSNTVTLKARDTATGFDAFKISRG